MSNYELMMVEQRGWRDGAAARAMNETNSEHSEPTVRTAYKIGYSHGLQDRKNANAEIAKRHGITQNEIKLMVLR